MAILKFLFFEKKKNTAKEAKKRLQIILEKEKNYKIKNNYLPKLKIEIVQVICKYIKTDPTSVNIQLEYKKNKISILEMNVIFPESNTDI